MDKHGFNGMKITGPKVFATFVITTLGFAFFMISPLWVGLLLVIPGFSMYLRYVLKQDLKFNQGHELIPINNSDPAIMMGCKTFSDRKKRFGF